MSYSFKKKTGVASTGGSIIHTVSATNTVSLISCRAANKDSTSPHTFYITIDDVLISGKDTPLPVGSAIDIMVGSKIIVEAGSTITAYADSNDSVDIYISYLEQ